jgi:hypothetical protein
MVMGIESLFPRLAGTDYRGTSPPADNYNCIGWAAGDTTAWWWPGDPGATYWPAGMPREETPAAFRAAFAKLGYVPC